MRSVELAVILACLTVVAPSASAKRAAAIDVVESAARGAALAEYRTSEKATQAVWDRMPMASRRVLFAKGPVKQFGAYEARGDNSFKDSEKVISYIEPIGFVFRDVGDGVLAYGFKIDLLVKKAAGETLLDKHDYAVLDSRTRSRKEEVEFDSSLDIKGLAPGSYSLEFTFRDIYSDKKMVVKQTFQVVS